MFFEPLPREPPPPSVAALYIDEHGPYATLGGVDPWGERRDARRYAGPHPVVAHPPCGPWGNLRALCRLQDASLASLAVAQVRRWGGVLEHPVGSRLWSACDLPAPGAEPDAWGGVTIRVDQVAWGHACRKPTLLYLVGIDPAEALASARHGGQPTHAIASRSRRGDLLAPSAAVRRRTPPAFARWLVELAARAAGNFGEPEAPGLWLTSGSGYSRVDLRGDGLCQSAATWGPGHETRARAIALAVRAAMRTGTAAALGRLLVDGQARRRRRSRRP